MASYFMSLKASEITSTMTSVVSDLSYTKCHSLAQMNDMSFIRTHSAQKNTPVLAIRLQE